MYTGNPGHLKSFNYVGFHRYSLTFCTYQRQPLFVREPVVALVLLQISRAAVEQRFAVIAYGFMPDHLHLLVEGQAEASDGKRVITRAKQYSGHDYSKLFQGRLWQRYGFDHVLRDEKLTLAVARYMLNNPIRSGLVRNVGDYPFVGSLVYGLGDLLDGIRSG
jgi:putative transposase